MKDSPALSSVAATSLSDIVWVRMPHLVAPRRRRIPICLRSWCDLEVGAELLGLHYQTPQAPLFAFIAHCEPAPKSDKSRQGARTRYFQIPLKFLELPATN
jgi:hypothetical protein